MMSKLPITLALFLTSKGHHGSQTLYRNTLEHLDAQIPLAMFAAKVASIKIQPGEERVAEVIKSDLESSGFKVITATAEWSRGQSHFLEMLKDEIRVSQLPEVNDNPFIWQCDDDTALLSHRDSLTRVLARMTSWLASSPDHITARFLRREDLPAALGIQSAPSEESMMFTTDVNFQQPLLRSRDYYHMMRVIEANLATASQMHIEALWREVLSHLSRGQKRHMVWHPDYCEAVHLGVPNYAEICGKLNLTVYPNP